MRVFSFFPKFMVILMVTLMSASALAADLYVSPGGSDSGSGSASSPFRTIQKAANVATAGSTVHVAPGNYAESIYMTRSGTASARIRFVSTTKWGAKIVPPASGSRAVAWDIRGSYIDIEGFEVDGSNHQGGTKWRTGIYAGGSYTVIKNSHVHHLGTSVNCDNMGGSAIGTDHYYHGVHNDVIGSVVHHIGSPTCRFIQGIYISTSGQVKNNLAYQVGGAAVHLWHDAQDVIIANNTVFSSGVGIVVGGGDFYHLFNGADNVHVSNNIVFDNGMGVTEQGLTGPNNTYTNNLVFNNSRNWDLDDGKVHTGTVAADPQFVNYVRAGGGDYHLKETSPAVDAGVSTYAPPTDHDGNARVGAVDIGAFEYQGADTAPELSLSASTVDFGSVVVGETSAVQVLTFENTGTADLWFTSGFVMSSGFSGSGNCYTTTPLAPGASCSLNMRFTPAEVGTANGTLTISTNAVSSPDVVPLSGRGVSSLAPELSLSASDVDFGHVLVGETSAVQVLTFENTGTADLWFTSGFVMSSGFSGSGNCYTTTPLAPGASCSLNMRFAPTEVGTANGTLTISTNAASSPDVVPLSGTGTSPSAPALSLSANSVDFGEVLVDETSAVQTLTFKNTGTADLWFTSGFVMSSGFSGSGNCYTTIPLAPGESCVLNMRFTPAEVGTATGTLTISTNAPSSPDVVPLSGTGTPPGPALSLSADTVSFGSVPVGGTSAVQVLTFTNAGTEDLWFTSAFVMSSGFSGSGNCYTTVPLAPGESCSLNMKFTPTVVGTTNGTLTISTNDPNSPRTVPLSGTGTSS